MDKSNTFYGNIAILRKEAIREISIIRYNFCK